MPLGLPSAVVEALESGKKLSVRVGNPRRDAFLFIPAALVYIAAACGAVALAIAGLSSVAPSEGAIFVILPVLSLVAGFAGFAIVGGVAWGIYALVVLLASVLYGVTERQELRVLPFVRSPDASALGPQRRGGDFLRSAFARLGKRKRELGLALVGGWFVLQLIFELAAPKPFGGRDLGGMLKSAAIAGIAELVVLGIMSIPLAAVMAGAPAIADRVALAWRARHDEEHREALLDPELALEELGGVREIVIGRTLRAEGDPLIAPLSGKPCLAFRLSGRAGRAEIDDSAAVPFVFLVGEEEVPVRGTSFAIALGPAAHTVFDLDAEQSQRVEQFLAARDLCLAAGFELGEVLLLENERVSVSAARSSEMVADGGYRAASRRRVLDDSDGLPVLVTYGI